jgi:hypothetical protein
MPLYVGMLTIGCMRHGEDECREAAAAALALCLGRDHPANVRRC